MTDENKFDAQSRRQFLKTTGAVGVAATAGVGAFGGNAAAQDITSLDTDSLNIVSRATQTTIGGLITVNLQNVDIDVLNDLTVEDVTVTILENVDVDVKNVRVLNNNTVNITVSDVLNNLTIQDNQVPITVSLLNIGSVTDVTSVNN